MVEELLRFARGHDDDVMLAYHATLGSAMRWARARIPNSPQRYARSERTRPRIASTERLRRRSRKNLELVMKVRESSTRVAAGGQREVGGYRITVNDAHTGRVAPCISDVSSASHIHALVERTTPFEGPTPGYGGDYGPFGPTTE
jgi:hypothetical protein